MPYATLRRQVASPIDWMVVLGMLAYSTFQLITDTYPGAIQGFTTDAYRIAWGIFMVLGFGSAFMGMLIRNHSKALSFEAFGMYLGGFATLIYCAALLGLGTSRAYLAATSFAVIGLGCIGQGLFIHRGLRKIGAGKFKIYAVENYKPTVLPELKDE